MLEEKCQADSKAKEMAKKQKEAELLNKIKLILITEASDGRGIDITGIEETEDIEEIEEIESDNEVRCLKRSFDRRNW